MTDERNGIAARVEILERQQGETFRRLRTVDRIEERMKHVEGDMADCAQNCQAIREWVEQQLRETRNEETERHRLTAMEKVAIIGAIAVVVASIIAALASLAAAGAV